MNDFEGVLRHHILAKSNTRAFSMLCAIILISDGLSMCAFGLSGSGSIDLKAASFEGNLRTGSRFGGSYHRKATASASVDGLRLTVGS